MSGRELWVSDGTETGTALIKEVRPGPDSHGASEFVAIGGRLFFNADDGLSGRELWVSDGTPAGTARIRDVNPGAPLSDVRDLRSADGLLYFRAIDSSHGSNYDVWRSDGTEAGTLKVTDVLPIRGLSDPWDFTSLAGTLFFSAGEGQGDRELWRTDWTAAGTFRVKDIRPGTESSNPSDLAAVDGRLFFAADDGVSGREPWVSDGTEAGTFRIKDARPGPESSHARDFTQVGDRLVFAAWAEQNGYQLWATDGTVAGTLRLEDFGFPSGVLRSFLKLGEQLCFVVDPQTGRGHQLWLTDGTEAGTRLVKEYASVSWSWPHQQPPADLGNRLLVVAADDRGAGLWESDGTPDGTVFVKDLQLPTLGSFGGYSAPHYAALGSSLLFAADDGARGKELWKTDGTPDGTVLVRDVVLGPGGPDFRYPTSTGTRVYFPEVNGSVGGVEDGAYALWTSDGTEAGTVPVRAAGSGVFLLEPQGLTNADGTLFFVAHVGDGNPGLWATEGTEARRLTTDYVGGDAHQGEYFFAQGTELWKSDGTAQGTGRVFAFLKGFSGPGASLGRFLCFWVLNDQDVRELWKTDGTEAGTMRIRAIEPADVPPKLTSVGDRLFFIVGDQLWTSDGTEEGTRAFLRLDSAERYSAFATVSDKFLFGAESSGRVDLWVTDGTEQGTQKIRSAVPAFSRPAGSIAPWIELHGVTFFALGSENGHFLNNYVLWKTDGTPEGTSQVSDLLLKSRIFGFPTLASAGGTLYFYADDGFHGNELWKLESIPGDTNFDNVVDVVDFGRVKANFGRRGDNLTGELDYDGDVDLSDFGILKAHFGDRLDTSAAAQAAPPIAAAEGTGAFEAAGRAAADVGSPPAPVPPQAPLLSDREDLPHASGGPAAAAIDLLPDLIVWSVEDRGYVHGWTVETSPTRTLLRLTTAMANVGAGPLELVGSITHQDGTQDVLQRISRDDGTRLDRLAGTFVFHPSHNHVHFEDFTEYNLRAVLPDNQVGDVVATSEKISFCLTDFDDYDEALVGAPDLGAFHGCGTTQGISVGWADIYQEGLPDQWIDCHGRAGRKILTGGDRRSSESGARIE